MATAGQGIGEAPCVVETDQVSEGQGLTHFRMFLFLTNPHIVLSWLSCDNVCTDGMDREDSYPNQSCPMANHQGTMAGSLWEDLCSSASICSQSSDEEMKPMGQSNGELYPTRGDTRDYPPAAVNLLPHSGPSAGMGPPVDPGGPQYSGKDLQSLHQSCLYGHQYAWLSLKTF